MKALEQSPSTKEIYFWNIAGSMFNAMLSVLILMVVTRVLPSDQADIFSIGWTISQLMATIGTYQLRVYQATDITEKFRFKEYLIFRFLSVFVMLVVSYIYVILKGYDGYKALIVLILCLFRAVEAITDVYEGWLQQKERLDLVGKAIVYRIVLALLFFGASLIWTGNLLIASIVLVLSYVFCLLAYDVRYRLKLANFYRTNNENCCKNWIGNMIKEGAPLFINAFLMMSITNAPKMVIDQAIENGNMANGIQTIFNILFMPASFLSLAYIVFRPMVTQMAIEWNTGKANQFLRILMRIFVWLLLLAVFIMIGSAILGIPILSLFYAIDLKGYKMELLIIILGGCLYTFAIILDNALIVIRRQYLLVIAYVFTWGFVKITANLMVERWGTVGAALVYTIGMSVFFLCMAVMFLVCLGKTGRTLKKGK